MLHTEQLTIVETLDLSTACGKITEGVTLSEGAGKPSNSEAVSLACAQCLSSFLSSLIIALLEENRVMLVKKML